MRVCKLHSVRTRPYPPKTNGEAERLIRTCLREWAYAATCQSSTGRAAHFLPFLPRYHWHRAHHSLPRKAPANTLPIAVNNLLTLHRWG